MAYQVKTPWWLSDILYSKLIWKMPADADNSVYLTFDDGPEPVATPKVLELRARHGARATFFVIGERAARYPEVLAAIAAAA